MKKLIKGILIFLALAILAIGIWGYAPDTDPAAMRAKYANAASRFIAVQPGLNVHVRDEGKRDGPALVLLHGSNSSLHTWEPWVKRLGTTYRIISIDQIGHGLTGPNPTDDYSAKAYVATLDAVMTKIGIDKFALAGSSMGGWVAWEYALVHPDKVSALVLIDASGPAVANAPAPALAFRIAQSPLAAPVLPYFTPKRMVADAYRKSVERKAVVTDDAVTRIWELLRYPGNRVATGIRQRSFPTRAPATPERMAKLTMPTLVLWGERDSTLLPAGADWFARTIPGARKIIYPNVGHLPMEEIPDQTARDLDQFLKDVKTTSN